MPSPAVRIGCAGWSIPSRHAHLFGEGDSHLARYATRFDVVEINSTFYRPHQPSLVFDARLADRFFAMLRRRCQARVACEPRHASWFTAPADAVLARHAIACAAADPAPVPEAALPSGTGARWSYWRWHGAPRMYYSAYEDAALRPLSQALARAATSRAPAWCIFDNTAHGHAMADAATLQALLGMRPAAG